MVVCCGLVAVCLRKKRKTKKYNNVQVAPLSQRIVFDNESDRKYLQPPSSDTGDVANEGAALPMYLRYASNTAVVAAATRLGERSTTRAGRPEGRAHPRNFSDTDVVTAAPREAERFTLKTDRPTTGAQLRNSSDTEGVTPALRAAGRASLRINRPKTGPPLPNAFDAAVDYAASLSAEVCAPRAYRPMSTAYKRKPFDPVVVTTVSRAAKRSTSRADRSKTGVVMSNPCDTVIVTAVTRAAEGCTPRGDRPKTQPSLRNDFDTAVFPGDIPVAESDTPRTQRPSTAGHPSNPPDRVPTASCATKRSTPRTGEPKHGVQAASAVDIKEGIIDVHPTAAGPKIVSAETTTGTTVEAGSSSPSGGTGVAKAFLEVACKLTTQSPCPVVCEAATLVSILVGMVSDDGGSVVEVESSLKRCRVVIMILERASLVLEKVRVPDRGR